MIQVLAIEDNSNDRKVLEKALKHSSIASLINVTFYTQVEDVKNINSYDIVITDLRLGKTNGAETIEAIRALTNAPIIIISGSYLSKENERAMLIAAANKSSCRYIQKGDNWTTKIGGYIRDVLRESFYHKTALHCALMIKNEQ
jgi:CheY-like chemotaxis protein